MTFFEAADILRKRGYVERETGDRRRTFYEFDTWDFLTSDVAKKFDIEYKDGEVEKMVCTQYFFGTTTFKEINDLEELKTNV